MSLAEQKQNIVDDFTKLVEKHKDEILHLCIKNNPDIIKYIKEGQLVDTSCMTTSAYVKKNIVNKVREIGGVEITFLKVRSILPMANCHMNSILTCLVLNKHYNLGLETIVGYNLTACECNSLCSFEVHSVVKYQNRLVDLTTDFGKETGKYFIPLKTVDFKSIIPLVQYLKESKKDYVHISARRVHRCNNGRASYYYEVPKDYKASTIEDLKKTFAIIQKVVFL